MSHDIDPQGDVLLLLYDPNTSLSAWNTSIELKVLYRNILTKKGKKKDKKLVVRAEINELDQNIRSFTNLPIQGENVATCTESPQLAELSDSIPSEQPSTSTQTPTTQEADKAELRLRVSSRHLMLASPHFNRMFSNGWEEESSRTVRVEGWDPEALLILMNIIHGRTRRIPRLISVELLAKLAVLVDYYDCLEAVEIPSENWIEKLKSQVPTTYCRELVIWILISLVFQQSELFESLSAVAIKQRRGRFQTLGLPFPENVIGMS